MCSCLIVHHCGETGSGDVLGSQMAVFNPILRDIAAFKILEVSHVNSSCTFAKDVNARSFLG